MSAEGERSPKRQRRSYSPASPPAASDNKEAFVQPPQTPPPSVHMSPSWQSQQLPGLQNTGNGSSTFPATPSSAGFQSQMMGRATSSEGRGGADSGEPTPAGEVEAAAGSNDDGAGDATIGGVENSSGVGNVSASAEANTEHRRSDHERQETQDTTSSKLDSSQLYKLLTEPIPPSQPHPSQDLLELYDLRRLQTSVARRDPNTGEKLVKLRKSYENQIKALEIEGRIKPKPTDFVLLKMMDPEKDWADEEGRPMWEREMEGEDGEAVLGGGSELESVEAFLNTGGALDLRPGSLPRTENESWKHFLGFDDLTTSAPPAKTAASTIATPHGPSRTASSTNPLLTRTLQQPAVKNNSAPASPRNTHINHPSGLRPERSGKKRRYDESSYAGYAEGYEDDGYSTGGGGGLDERRGSQGRTGSGSAGGGGIKRQKRKDFPGNPSPSSASPPFSTPGGGMVGVRSS